MWGEELLEWAGFNKLRKNKIHIYCPKCGRKQSNAWRDPEMDPPEATLAHVFCDKCSAGCKDVPVYYWTNDGKRLLWGEDYE